VPRPEGRKRRAARRVRAAESEAREGRPAAQAVWSGTLSFGLVSVPIELYSAQRGDGVSLRMLAPDGVPLSRQYVCPAEDDRPLERDEIVRGHPVGEGEFVVLSDEELEALAPRRSRDIELQSFVDRGAIDPVYFVRAYYLVPSGQQTKAYRLLAETMEATGRAAIASFVMHDKAHAVAIFADAGILRAETLRFGDELRSAADLDLPEPGKTDAARVRELAQAIGKLAKEEVDEAEMNLADSERLLALARRKLKRGKDVVELPEEATAAEDEGGNVVDLMALLKQRLRAPEGGRRPKRAGSRPRKRAAGGRSK
jgi:DNA end-binding protein Ku